MKRITKSRREFTTQGADPTVVVEWRVGDEFGENRLVVNEFQNVYRGRWDNSPRGDGVELTEFEAQLIHEGLEAGYQLGEVMKAINEGNDSEEER